MKNMQEGVSDIYQKNLQAIALNRPDIYSIISGHPVKDIGQIIPTATVPTFLIDIPGKPKTLLYNSENPWKDVEPYLTIIDSDKYDQKCIFFGNGLGYGPLLVLKERPNIPKVIIFEPSIDLFIAALKLVDLRPLITSKKVVLYIGEPDFNHFRTVLSHSAMDRIHFFNLKPLFDWAPEWYSVINQEVYKIANDVSVTAATTAKHGVTLFQNLIGNLSLIRHAHFLEDIQGIADDKPAILVSAGPSLNKSISFIKKSVGKAVIICADAALKPLTNAGIMPDFVTAIDMQNINFEKFASFTGSSLPFSLVTNPKVTPLIPKRLNPEHLFFAFSNNTGDKRIKDVLGVKKCVPHYPSVAHLSLGVALTIGADPIIYIGHDLAYTSSESDHAAGTVISLKSGNEDAVIFDKDCVQVMGINGESLKTHRGYFEFKVIFETIMAEYPRTYINGSTQGAHLEGAGSMDHASILKNYITDEFNISSRIEAHVKRKKSNISSTVLVGLDSLIDELKIKKESVRKTAKQVFRLKELFSENELGEELNTINSPDGLPKHVNMEIVELNELKKNSGRFPYMEELFFKSAVEIDRRILINEQTFSENYVEGVRGMLDIMVFENEEHERCIDQYLEELTDLREYLLLEKELLHTVNKEKENKKHILNLANVYCEAENFILAENCLASVYEDSSNAEFLYLKGSVNAGLLNASIAHENWDSAVSLDQTYNGKVRHIKAREASLWLITLTGCQLNLRSVYRKRVWDIANDVPWVINEIERLWEFESQKCKRMLTDNKFNELSGLIEEWKDYNSVLPEWFYYKARLLVENNETSSALSAIEIAVNNRPDNGEWLALFARLLIENGAFDNGIKTLKEAVRLKPETATLWEELGDVLYETKDFEGALISYENCFTALPEHLQALRKKGDCYFELESYESAVTSYEKVLEKDPANDFAKESLKRIMKIRKG